MASSAWVPEVRAFASEMMAKHCVPGFAVAVAHGGTEVYAEGFGEREIGMGVVVTPDTVFGVASVTKSFTALAIMQLAEAGKLSVDDPVTRYLPEFRTPDPVATRAITLHHFLSHTAGLPPLPSRFFAFAHSAEGDPAAGGKPAWSADHAPIGAYEDLMAYLAAGGYTLLGPPGAQFSYCNEEVRPARRDHRAGERAGVRSVCPAAYPRSRRDDAQHIRCGNAAHLPGCRHLPRGAGDQRAAGNLRRAELAVFVRLVARRWT